MIHEATQSLDLASDKDLITENKDLLTKKVRWDKYLKATAYLFYSLFVALLSVSIIFSKANEIIDWNISIDLIAIFIGLFALLFSLGLISWIYKGTMKKLYIYNYYVIHFLNALALLVIISILSFPNFNYDINATANSFNYDMLTTRSLIFGIGLIVWAFMFSVGLLFNVSKMKKTFPTTWLKTKLSIASIFVFPIIAIVSWISSTTSNELKEMLLWIELVIFLLSIVYLSYIYSYIKAFKEALLSNKTDKEIDRIDVLRNVSFLMILFSSISLFVLGVYKVLPIWNDWSSNGQMEISAIISICIDAIMLTIYLIIIIVSKRMKSLSKLSTIDNSILMDFFTWLLLVKTIILVALFGTGLNLSGFMSLSSCFMAIFILNISTILLGVNFPNIKNITFTIVNIISALSVLSIVLFQSTFQELASQNIFESTEMILLIMLPVVLAISINLSIKLISYSKIRRETNSTTTNSKEKSIFNNEKTIEDNQKSVGKGV